MLFNFTKTMRGVTLMKFMLMLLLSLCFPMLCSAASASGKTNQIITLSIKDASSTGSNIYNDLLSGKTYAVSYTWKSSNESVTQWSHKANTFAYVKFTKAGNYTVSFDLKYSFSGASKSYNFPCTWNVIVTEDGPSGVSVSVDKNSIEVGQTVTARATIYGGTGSVSWSKGNSSCISITPSGNTCQIKGLSKGTAAVTATTNNGHSDFIPVTVTEPATIPNTIKLSKSSIELIEGQTTSITAQITGDNSNVCEWKCSDTDILSLAANGKSAEIRAKKVGNAIIYAIAYDGTKASCQVTVSKDPDKEFSGEWAIAGNFNVWTDTEMIHQGNGIFKVKIDRLIPEFKFKTVGSWDNILGAANGTRLEVGKAFSLTDNSDNIIFTDGVAAINNAYVTLDVPAKTVLITGTVEYSDSDIHASSLDDFYSKSGADQVEVTADFSLTATYVNQQYCYVIDSEGTPGLIYGTTPYSTLDIIPAGWKGKYTKYYGQPEIVPSGTMPDASRKGSFTPHTYSLSDINLDMVNEIVILKNVTFDEDTPSARTNFTATSADDSTTVTFRNQFYTASVPAGTYNVMAAIGVYNTELQIYPIEYTDIDPDYGDWCITGAFNKWSDTLMTHQGNGVFTAVIDRLIPEFKFKTVGSWDNILGAANGTRLEVGKTFSLTDNSDNIIFTDGVAAINNAYVTLDVPKKTALIQGKAASTGSKVSFSDVNCKWGMTRQQVISSQEGGYYICQENETIVVFSKMDENNNEIYLAYKFDSDGKLCASTLSMPENNDYKHISDEFFAQYDSEISLEDGLEVKTDDSNLIALDISSTINGGGNIITLGFSYYEPLEERDDCVDLGLSVRWATMNLGASKPSGVGGFYAFSETATKSEYWRENYAYCNNNSNQYIFDYTNPQANICGTKYDVATKQLGEGWKMPSLAEANELISKCTWEKETVDGIQVYRVTGPNGNSIILPIVGWKKQRKDYSTTQLHLGIGECLSKSSESTYIITTERSGQTYKGAIGQEWKAWGYNIRPVYTK